MNIRKCALFCAWGLAIVMIGNPSLAIESEMDTESDIERWLPADARASSSTDKIPLILDWEVSEFIDEGNRYQRQGDLESAINLYERCRKHDSRRIEVLPYLGLALDRLGRYEEAILRYYEYLDSEPEDDLVKFNCGVSLLHAEQDQQAIDMVEPLLKKYSIEPIYTLLGVAHRRLGNMDKAFEFLKKAVSIAPQRCRVHTNLAVAYLEFGDMRRAKDCLIEALRLDPRDGKALNNAGSVLEADGKYDLADKAFEIASRQGVSEAEVNRLSLACNRKRACPLMAAEIVDKHPESAEARLLYAWILMEEGRQREATSELENWQRDHDADNSSFAYLGTIYYRLGKYDKALEQFRRELGVRDDWKAHYNASLCLAKLKRFEEAEVEARLAYANSKEYPEVIYNLAKRCEQVGNKREAKSLYLYLDKRYPAFIDGHKLSKYCESKLADSNHL